MDKQSVSARHNHHNNNSNSSNRDRNGADGSLLLRAASSDAIGQSTPSDFVLQWGNRKRLRCMKIQVKDDSSAPVHRTTVRVDRRVVRADKDANHPTTTIHNNNNNTNGYLNLRQRPPSPQQPPSHRVLRNSETSSAMRGQSNGGVRGIASPDRGAHDKKGTTTNNNNNHHHHNENNKSAASSETAHDSKKGGSSSGSGEAAVAPPVWPPKFVIALTNKEKEEDFIAFKGSKLPQRPKKRAKFIQRTLNLVSPGAWLCDLTLERYEVREKKISKKRPRGLKAMGNMESDSE
ncbi:SWI5-dependent HO expression protein 3 [Ziziphus jujuba]|uniref:SWI5-dependent HO expression protein 3 n=1 Tax=Ziziphus jujuba TaxID=326968 RepID=A0A6P3ZT78_ZIZJJ|nr:SWI5-dependent HO expression protein 3 [Ziziphus jujuba]